MPLNRLGDAILRIRVRLHIGNRLQLLIRVPHDYAEFNFAYFYSIFSS